MFDSKVGIAVGVHFAVFHFCRGGLRKRVFHYNKHKFTITTPVVAILTGLGRFRFVSILSVVSQICFKYQCTLWVNNTPSNGNTSHAHKVGEDPTSFGRIPNPFNTWRLLPTIAELRSVPN
ncbi:hypothetical protein N9140_00825 [bacterium]|nr:hypothetical protein [bacterium]